LWPVFNSIEEVREGKAKFREQRIHIVAGVVFREQLAPAIFRFYEGEISFGPGNHWTNPTDIPG
jgi:hypothetical protein